MVEVSCRAQVAFQIDPVWEDRVRGEAYGHFSAYDARPGAMVDGVVVRMLRLRSYASTPYRATGALLQRGGHLVRV